MKPNKCPNCGAAVTQAGRCEYCNTLLAPEQQRSNKALNLETYTSKVDAVAPVNDKTNMGKYFGGCVGMFVICAIVSGLIKNAHEYDAILGVFGLLWFAAFGATIVSFLKWAFKKLF